MRDGTGAEPALDWRPVRATHCRRSRQILDRAGIDLRQQVHLGADELIGRVEFAHPELAMVVEGWGRGTLR